MKKFKSDKGQAGLTLLLSVIATVFIIGFLVMIFVIMGANLRDNSYTATTGTQNLEAGAINVTGYRLAHYNLPDFSPTIVAIVNATDNKVISSGNYTLLGNFIYNKSAVTWSTVKINYTYTYGANNTASAIIEDTNTSIADVPTWFPIIITIAVMVCLILLTTIIIVAIRSTGLISNQQ